MKTYKYPNVTLTSYTGGDSASECFNWYKRSGVGSRVVLTSWDSDEEDAHLVGRPIDITDIVKYASQGEGKLYLP